MLVQLLHGFDIIGDVTLSAELLVTLLSVFFGGFFGMVFGDIIGCVYSCFVGFMSFYRLWCPPFYQMVSAVSSAVFML